MKWLGYQHSEIKTAFVKNTLLNHKELFSQDIYLDNVKNRTKKLDVYKNDNHEVIFSQNFVIIQTINENKHFKNIDKVLDVIQSNILDLKETSILGVSFEASTTDYVKNIKHVEKHYNNLKVDHPIKEDYNVERKTYENYAKKDSSIEHYSSEYLSSYFNEYETCYIKEENFATAEYYNDNIGRVIINTDVYLQKTENNSLTKDNISGVIAKLREEQELLLLKSFKEEYKLKLLFD